MIARRIFVLMVFSICLFMIPALGSSAPYYEIAQEINNAYVAKKPCPLVSQKIKGLTVDQAFEIQTAVVELRENKGEMVMGYKAGGWSPQFQKRFGLKQPIWGTLFKSMLRWPGKIYLKGHVRMFIEPEIGFRFQQDITEPVRDIRTLKRAVAIVYPAIELPDLGFADMKSFTGVDILAGNAGARKVLIGNAARVRDLNAVKVTLYHNDKELTKGIGKNAGGDQWEALRWVVNDVLARGGKVKDGYIVVTGCLTKLLPAKPGKYVVDYGDFGKIEFECK
jgi:2-keto-4-pentenoate hydratase